MKAFIYNNDTAEMLIFEGTTPGVSGGQFVVTAPQGTGGLTRNEKYKYSLKVEHYDVKTATLTNIEGLKYTFKV